jgi:hypothetical protein
LQYLSICAGLAATSSEYGRAPVVRRGLKQSTTKVEYTLKPHPDEYKNVAAIGDFLREVRLFTYKIDVVEWRALRRLA